MVANGEPPRMLALVDPDSDLLDAVERTGRAVVQLLSWRTATSPRRSPAPRRRPAAPFRTRDFEDTAWGPRLALGHDLGRACARVGATSAGRRC